MSDPIRIPVTYSSRQPDGIDITPDIARQIVALAYRDCGTKPVFPPTPIDMHTMIGPGIVDARHAAVAADKLRSQLTPDDVRAMCLQDHQNGDVRMPGGTWGKPQPDVDPFKWSQASAAAGATKVDFDTLPCGICGERVRVGMNSRQYHDCKPVPGAKLDKALADLAAERTVHVNTGARCAALEHTLAAARAKCDALKALLRESVACFNGLYLEQQRMRERIDAALGEKPNAGISGQPSSAAPLHDLVGCEPLTGEKP